MKVSYGTNACCLVVCACNFSFGLNIFWMSVGRDLVLSVLLVGWDGVEVVEEEYHLIVTAYKKI